MADIVDLTDGPSISGLKRSRLADGAAVRVVEKKQGGHSVFCVIDEDAGAGAGGASAVGGSAGGAGGATAAAPKPAPKPPLDPVKEAKKHLQQIDALKQKASFPDKQRLDALMLEQVKLYMSCSICLEDGKHASLGVLSCGHIFHQKCVGKCMNAERDAGKQPSCPQCRAKPVQMSPFFLG